MCIFSGQCPGRLCIQQSKSRLHYHLTTSLPNCDSRTRCCISKCICRYTGKDASAAQSFLKLQQQVSDPDCAEQNTITTEESGFATSEHNNEQALILSRHDNPRKQVCLSLSVYLCC
jgi:hypothetical protein